VCNQNVIEDTFIKLNSSHKVEDKIINTSSVPKLMAQLYLNTDISIIKMHIDTFESGQSYDTFFWNEVVSYMLIIFADGVCSKTKCQLCQFGSSSNSIRDSCCVS
jgi:hypothetical protein